MKANEVLNNFGAEFISGVRDRTIDNIEMILSGKMKSDEASELFRKVNDLDEKYLSVIRELIMKAIDNELFNILMFFEQSDEYAIHYQDENINELSDGLAGELYSDAGWIAKYSKHKG